MCHRSLRWPRIILFDKKKFLSSLHNEYEMILKLCVYELAEPVLFICEWPQTFSFYKQIINSQIYQWKQCSLQYCRGFNSRWNIFRKNLYFWFVVMRNEQWIEINENVIRFVCAFVSLNRDRPSRFYSLICSRFFFLQLTWNIFCFVLYRNYSVKVKILNRYIKRLRLSQNQSSHSLGKYTNPLLMPYRANLNNLEKHISRK